MKLKMETINEYNVLVDENPKIEKRDYLLSKENIIHNNYRDKAIIFADPELNLNLPILPNWEQLEVENLAKKYTKNSIEDFILGYTYNKAKYTKDNLKGFIDYLYTCKVAHKYKDGYGDFTEFSKCMDKYIKSLKKLPKYIVVESERCRYPKGDDGWEDVYLPKLITLPNGKQTGVIKEIIY